MKRLILGGAFQGKLEWFRQLGFQETEITEKSAAVYKLNTKIEELLRQGKDPQKWVEEAILSKESYTVVCDEVGAGIVPADKLMREYREAVGRACCRIASQADLVERVYAGVATVIRDCVQITLIRHGKTAGNLRGAYIGRTDESLVEKQLPDGVRYPKGDKIFVTGLKRTRETAELIYGDRDLTVIPEMNECDFGEYEGKNFQELQHCPPYIRWMESGGTIGFPSGEDRKTFSDRCCRGFLAAAKNLHAGEHGVFVCHGGSIMAILERFALEKKGFYDWQVKNLQGFTFRFDRINGVADKIERLEA